MGSYTVKSLWDNIGDLTYSQMLTFAGQLNDALDMGRVAAPTGAEMAEAIQYAFEDNLAAERAKEAKKNAAAKESA